MSEVSKNDVRRAINSLKNLAGAHQAKEQRGYWLDNGYSRSDTLGDLAFQQIPVPEVEGLKFRDSYQKFAGQMYWDASKLLEGGWLPPGYILVDVTPEEKYSEGNALENSRENIVFPFDPSKVNE